MTLFKTDKQLDRCIRKWQKQLGLTHWTIVSNLCRYYEMPETDTAGLTMLCAERMEAAVFVLHPDDVASPVPFDQEVTVVHELVHIVFPFLSQKEHSVQAEQAIETVAKTLVELDAQKEFLLNYVKQKNKQDDSPSKKKGNSKPKKA